ncbi:MAG: DUF4974 domain-containing protein [Prevotella sp.]|nr:DUF4974 domain-containing protein [Prevotella sp.]
MEQQERIRLLLSMQEHPECYTDEQITQMLTDDPKLAEMMEQLAMTKRAFIRQEVNKEDIPMDDLWEQFASEHEGELDALESQQEQEASIHSFVGSKFGKILGMSKLKSRVPAVFIGLLVVSGVAFAAIHIARHYVGKNLQSPSQEAQISDMHQPVTPTDTFISDTIKNDTPVKANPVVYDNVTLDSIAKDIAAYYQIGLDLQNGYAHQLRFYFVWKQDDSLHEVVEKLNMFEQVNMSVENGKLIVR